MRKRTLGLALVASTASTCPIGPIAPAQPMTATAYCAQVSNQYGNAFFCATTQANLNRESFPDGSRGFCMLTDENLGLVGYSVITYNGGAFPVTSQSRASELTHQLGSQSPGYVRCTRE